jgi:hypothetical protein
MCRGFFFGRLVERARRPEPTALGYLGQRLCVVVDVEKPRRTGDLGASPGSFWGTSDGEGITHHKNNLACVVHGLK